MAGLSISLLLSRVAALVAAAAYLKSDLVERVAVDPRWYFLVDGILILYYAGLYKWLHRERDPAPVVTLYAPPEEISPAAARYLLIGDSDRQTVAAVLLDLAARGLVSISCLDNFYLITKRTNQLPPGIPAEEATAFKVMFVETLLPLPEDISQPANFVVPEGSFLVHPIAGPNFNLLASTIHASLRASFERKYFSRNLIYSIPAAVMSISLLLYNAFESSTAFYTSCFVLSGILFLNFTPYVRDIVRGRIRNERHAVYVLVLLMLYMGWTAILANEPKHYTNTFELMLIFAVILNIFLPAWLRTPSGAGRSLLNQVEGYREFLVRVEVERMHQLNDPNWSPGEKTRNLSYAVALDLHNAWEDYLANADFHSIVSEASKSKPTPPGMQPLSSGPNAALWGVVYRNAWRAGVFLLIALLANLMIPSELYYPRLLVTFVIGGLIAFRMPRPFRSE